MQKEYAENIKNAFEINDYQNLLFAFDAIIFEYAGTGKVHFRTPEKDEIFFCLLGSGKGTNSKPLKGKLYHYG